MTDFLRDKANEIVKNLVGDKVSEKWWIKPNHAFDGKTPNMIWQENKDIVYQYLKSHLEGEW